MYGKSIGDTEAFQKVKSDWLYHQRQKHCYIQVALILQEPIDVSPGTGLLTTPPAEKAESVFTGGEWGCTLHSDFTKLQYPLQRMGPSPLLVGLWDLLLQLHHHQPEFCANAAGLPQLWAGEGTQPPKHSLVWFLKTMKENGASKTMKNSHIPWSLCSYFSS